MKIALCCTKKEYDAMRELSRLSTSRSFSEYARKVLLNRPVTITIRDLSLNSLIDAVNGIRNELEGLLDRPSLKQADINQLAALIKELKLIFYQIADQCIQK